MDLFDVYRIAESVHVIILVEKIQILSLSYLSITLCGWARYFRWYWGDEGITALVLTVALSKIIFLTKEYVASEHCSCFSLLFQKSWKNFYCPKQMIFKLWYWKQEYIEQVLLKLEPYFCFTVIFTGPLAHHYLTLVQFESPIPRRSLGGCWKAAVHNVVH